MFLTKLAEIAMVAAPWMVLPSADVYSDTLLDLELLFWYFERLGRKPPLCLQIVGWVMDFGPSDPDK